MERIHVETLKSPGNSFIVDVCYCCLLLYHPFLNYDGIMSWTYEQTQQQQGFVPDPESLNQFGHTTSKLCR